MIAPIHLINHNQLKPNTNKSIEVQVLIFKNNKYFVNMISILLISKFISIFPYSHHQQNLTKYKIKT